jgi:hypothetical protein
VRQVGHLPKLWEDARSGKYKLGYVQARYYKLQTDGQKETGEIVQEILYVRDRNLSASGPTSCP